MTVKCDYCDGLVKIRSKTARDGSSSKTGRCAVCDVWYCHRGHEMTKMNMTWVLGAENRLGKPTYVAKCIVGQCSTDSIAWHDAQRQAKRDGFRY